MARHVAPSSDPQSEDATLFPTLQREMNRVFDQMRAGLTGADRFPGGVFGAGTLPAIDVVETDDALEVSAELPGVREEDLDVSISGEILTLRGEKSHDHEEKEETYHRIERRYGRFLRRVPLGFTPGPDAVEATFSDGLLKLVIAKPAAAKADTRKIEIRKT